MFRVTVCHEALSWDISSTGTYTVRGNEQGFTYVHSVYVLYSMCEFVCYSIYAAGGI